MRRPCLAITMGDAAGIGPEVALKALTEITVRDETDFLLTGSYSVWNEAAHQVNFSKKLVQIPTDEIRKLPAALIGVVNSSALSSRDFHIGESNVLTGRAAGQAIESAAQLAMSGLVQAIVTAPIQKETLNLAGYHFPGHTEMLQHLAGADEVVMVMYSPKLTTALISTHLALAETQRAITEAKILRVLDLSSQFLKRVKSGSIRIGVAAYNPHAGEGGLFGTEEIETIRPAIEKANLAGIPAEGPFSPDTVFIKAVQGEFDLVVSMYHDQGLIPFKLMAFDEGVNVTLGLPFWRTSPDHGTALDLAGQNRANYKSMLEAIKLAVQLVKSESAPAKLIS